MLLLMKSRKRFGKVFSNNRIFLLKKTNYIRNGMACVLVTHWNHKDDANNVSLVCRLCVIQKMPVNMKNCQGNSSNCAWKCYNNVVYRSHLLFRPRMIPQ